MTAGFAHRRRADQAAEMLKAIAPSGGSYSSETDFFRPDWREDWSPDGFTRIA